MDKTIFPLFETIAIEQGKILNLAQHQARYEQSLRQFYGKSAVKIYDLLEILQKNTALWTTLESPLVRCRIDYHATDYHIKCFSYQRKTYRTFQPVIDDDIDYGLKYADRTRLNALLQQKGDCDEIMIIKQGCVTDCSIGNLIFRQGEQWFTPDTPLLAGTQRAFLLAQGKIQTRRILLENIPHFEEIRLINALNGLKVL